MLQRVDEIKLKNFEMRQKNQLTEQEVDMRQRQIWYKIVELFHWEYFKDRLLPCRW